MTFQGKYRLSQVGRTLVHPTLPQKKDEDERLVKKMSETISENDTVNSTCHTFVVCSDTQLGMTTGNEEWETELAYSRQAVRFINELSPRPLFCCMCGDLVEMGSGNETRPQEECDDIQERQRSDFQETWSHLHPEIALVCLCGNHDVGNRPTRATIDSFTSWFGDDYLAFWARRSYNIVLNSSLFSDSSGAPDLYEAQFQWLRERLVYARTRHATSILVFGHHPWFLYDENEEAADMTGSSPFKGDLVPDSYFHITKAIRQPILELFREYNVTAAFAGHFHQNLVSKTSFGMDMIITSSLSVVFESTGRPKGFKEPNVRGIRIVDVNNDNGSFGHRFVSLPE